MSGTLYIVGTPIGNMEDITARQLDTLKSVDFVCAEDTRVTVKLFNRYGIKNRLLSFHEHSAKAVADNIISRLADGESCAIVTDAGMPCISDPGQILVSRCAEVGIDVKVVPGPSAVVSAVAVSGFAGDRFTFEGFLPVSGREREERLKQLERETAIMVFYEAPHRLRETLRQFGEHFGKDRRVAICRELTKIHEQVLRMTLGEADEYYLATEPRGEFVIVVEGQAESGENIHTADEAVYEAKRLVSLGMKATDACREAAKKYGFKKNEIYSLYVGCDNFEE